MKKVEYVADGWAIASAITGKFLLGERYVISGTRSHAIQRFLSDHPSVRTWGEIYKAGYRCIRVYRKVSK